MTAPAFPVSQLGRPTVNYSLKPDDLRVRADTVSGLANSYNGSNAALTQISVKWEWGADNYAVFQDWYRNDCKDGSIEFTISEMYLFGSMGGITARFTAPPNATYKAWNHYSVSALLETRTTDYITEATLDAALPTDPHTDNVTWPSDLFGYTSGEGYGEEAQSSSLRGKTKGYARPAMRRNSPITVTQVTVKWEMSQANKILFDAWYHCKLVDGAAWFWIYTQFHGVWQYIKARFIESISIEYEPVDWWKISGTLETVPCVGQSEQIPYLPIADVGSIPSSGYIHLLITTQPESQSLRIGSTLSLSVSATGNYPITYQWYFNGSAITGATSQMYTVNSIKLSTAGTYYVVVQNAEEIVTSDNAIIYIYSGYSPSITTHPSSITRAVGSTATFSVIATSNVTTSGPLNYTWYRNGSAVGVEGSSSYSKTNVQLDNDGDQFYVLVGNTIGNTRSNTATLRVGYAPIITNQPVSWSSFLGEEITLFVVATTTTGSGVLRYQWYKGSYPIQSATAASYTISSASGVDDGNYSVVVSNDVGSVTSDTATVSVETNTILLLQVDEAGNIVERTGKTITTTGTVIVDHATTHDGYGSIRNTATTSSITRSGFLTVSGVGISEITEFTIEAYIRPLDNIGGTLFGNSNDPDVSTGQFIANNAQPYRNFSIYHASDYGSTVANWTHQNSGAWVHVAFVLHNSYAKVYVNGILDATGGYNTATRVSIENLNILAAEYLASDYPGPCLMENIRVSNIARYTGNFTPPERF